MMTDWKQISPLSLRTANARLALHYGVYLLGSAAHTLLQHAEDDSHTNLGFNIDSMSCVTHPLLDGQYTLSLAFEEFAIKIHREESGEITGELLLEGKTLSEALSWIQSTLRVKQELSLREYPDFPESPLREGEPFPATEYASRRELAHWFANALLAFQTLKKDYAQLSPLRVWPHHFDLGGLIPLEEKSGKMIGFGFSPGDHYYNQPYLYCSPYPAPKDSTGLPELEIGKWHTKDFTSAVVTSEELLSLSENPHAELKQYLSDSIAACSRLIVSD